MSDNKKFQKDCEREISQQGKNLKLQALAKKWIIDTTKTKYSYHFEWMGRPIIQHPQDIIGMQQLLWQVKPDLVIETGIARGGSIIFLSSILELIAQSGFNKNSMVLGVDIDIRKHNLNAIKKHPLSKRVKMIQGSSIDEKIFTKVKNFSKKFKKILVCLDSNHTENHVLRELEMYSTLVTKNSYCVVFDTIIADIPNNKKRPWNKFNNPKTAIKKFFKKINTKKIKASNGYIMKFEIDRKMDNQLLITCAKGGFLKRK